MLVLTRKLFEAILVFLDEETLLKLLEAVRAMTPDPRTGKRRIFLKFTVLESRSGQVKFGAEAPEYVAIHREEIAERIFAEEEESIKAKTANKAATA